jgi:GDP-L-fucose synthase
MISKVQKVFVAGHNGMVGSAIARQLSERPSVEVYSQTRDQLNLLDATSVYTYFEKNNFDVVYLAAAKVGGVHANNTYPAEFIFQNLVIQNNVIDAACKSGVEKLLFLGSSCIYPRDAKQPMEEADLLTGLLEPTNEPYAIAKIAGIKMCEAYNRQYDTDYRAIMPTNLYGPGDNYHPENSHVIPALIQRFHKAKMSKQSSVTVWGTGKALREFLHVDDMARACLHLMNLNKAVYEELIQGVTHVNAGTGKECSIKELTEMISDVTGYQGKLEWDTNMPDGTPRKLLDNSLIEKSGWKPEVSLKDGLAETYRAFVSTYDVGMQREK